MKKKSKEINPKIINSYNYAKSNEENIKKEQ